jgi:hypothetical protein
MVSALPLRPIGSGPLTYVVSSRMPAPLTFQRPSVATELQLHIAHQQALAAKLARESNVKGARAARAKLYVLLNQADLLKVAS